MHKEEKENLDPMIHRWVLLFLIGITFGGWGCAPTTVSLMGPAIRPPLGKYDEVIIGHFKGAQLSPDSQQKFTYKVQAKLMESGAFRSVTPASSVANPTASQVTLTGTITEFSEGSRALQWFIGFGAGASKAAGVFKLIDPKGKVLYQFSASTSYSGGLGIGGAPFLSMDDLLDRLASSVAQQTGKWVRGEPLQEESESES